MKVFTTWFLIGFLCLTAFAAQAQDWEWTLSCKPDISSGIYGISMLTDGLTGWGVGSDRDIGRIFHTTDGWQTWIEQTDTNTSKSKLSDVGFVDELNGWTVGADGIILHTSDGGASWEIQGEGLTTVQLDKISVVNLTHAFACGSDGVIIYTNDGTTWNSVNTGTTERFYGIDMFDAIHGIAVGKSETIYYTTDGSTWNPATTKPSIGGKDFNAVAMADQNTAWLVGDGFPFLALKSVFAKTTDGGNTWTLWEADEMIMENMWAIDFASPTQGVAVGSNGWVFVTTDCNTWTPLPRYFADNSSAVAIVGDKIWATSGNGIIYYSENFGSNWSLLPDVNGNYLYKLNVIDNDRVIAVGYASSFAKTDDGGKNWRSGSVIANNNMSQQLWGVDFATSDIGWVAGSGGFIAKTSDGAVSWVLQAENVTNEWLRHIWAYNENQAWIVGKRGVILKTDDGGDNWEFQGFGLTTKNLNGIDALDQNRIAITGEKSAFFFTTDGGQTWEESTHNLDGEKKINALDLVDETNAWAVGADGLILFSSDAGQNWTIQNSPTIEDLDGVRFKDASTGWIAGDDGKIFETTDGGVNWEPIGEGITGEYLKSVDVTEDGKVFACGYSGVVVRYGPIFPALISDKTTNLPEDFRLGQNFPNPFNPVTTIEYQIPHSCRTKIVVYNALGQEVANLIDEEKMAGTFRLTWDASNMPAGIYFIKMAAENFSSVRKVLFIK